MPGGTQVSTHTAGGVTKHMHVRPFELVILLLSLCSCCKRVLRRKQSLGKKEDSLKPLDTASPLSHCLRGLCVPRVVHYCCEQAFSTSWERQGLKMAQTPLASPCFALRPHRRMERNMIWALAAPNISGEGKEKERNLSGKDEKERWQLLSNF